MFTSDNSDLAGTAIIGTEEAADERAWARNEVKKLRGTRHADSAAGGSAAAAKALQYVTANLAHDLNNVLAPITTSIEVLRMHYAGDDKAQELLSLLERHVRQGPYLAKQVRSLAQAGENAYTQIRPEFLMQSLRQQLRDACPKNVEIKLKIEGGLWPIFGSLLNLHEALVSLCVNACEAMPNGGVLKVTAENIVLKNDFPLPPAGAAALHYVLFTVSDTHEGIVNDLLERILEVGFMTKNGTERGRELFRANKIIETHHGHLILRSEAGKGSIFKLYLPAALGAGPEPAAEDVQSLRGHGEGILVVDDEEALRAVTQETFESFGYQVWSAKNGADAVAAYLQEKHDIALVVTDMNMPIMDGAKTIHALRDINPGVKIIATSGQDSAAQVRRATHAGADLFVPKPFTAVKLLRTVHKMLSTAPTAHGLSY